MSDTFTLKEWTKRNINYPCLKNADDILRDWARDRKILEARIVELKETKSIACRMVGENEKEIDRLTKQNEILDDVIARLGEKNAGVLTSCQDELEARIQYARDNRQAAKEFE